MKTKDPSVTFNILKEYRPKFVNILWPILVTDIIYRQLGRVVVITPIISMDMQLLIYAFISTSVQLNSRWSRDVN